MMRVRYAAGTDVPALLALWEVAAENDSRPTDPDVRRRGVGRLLLG